MLLHIPGVLNREHVAAMRQELLASDWTDGLQTVGFQGAEVKRNLQIPEASPLRRRFGEEILVSLARNPRFFSAALPLKYLPPRFNLYQQEGAYGFHVDGSVMDLGQGERLRTDISCTLFLCDPDDYDGGELVISDTYGEHAIKLPAGDLILYPSSSLHRVAPVTRGARIASFFWVQSMVRESEKRQMLFELDSSIQSLTAAGADRSSLLGLTNVYHNLLRRWAEV